MWLILVLVSFSKMGHSGIEECFRDALTHGHHRNPHSPAEECKTLLKNYSSRIESRSIDGKFSALGANNMIYISSDTGTQLLAGNETRLKNISFHRFFSDNKKFIVYQENESVSKIMTFYTDLIGNVSPDTILSLDGRLNLSNIESNDLTGEIGLISKINKSNIFYNSISDNELEKQNAKFKVLKKRQIQGPSTELNSPLAAVHSPLKKLIYVLDSDRVLVYPETANGDVAPIKVIEAPGRSKTLYMKLNADQSEISFLNGWEQFPALKID